MDWMFVAKALALFHMFCVAVLLQLASKAPLVGPEWD